MIRMPPALVSALAAAAVAIAVRVRVRWDGQQFHALGRGIARVRAIVEELVADAIREFRALDTSMHAAVEQLDREIANYALGHLFARAVKHRIAGHQVADIAHEHQAAHVRVAFDRRELERFGEVEDEERQHHGAAAVYRRNPRRCVGGRDRGPARGPGST